MDTEHTPEKGRGETGCRTEDTGLILVRGSELLQQPSAGHDLDRGWGQRGGHRTRGSARVGGASCSSLSWIQCGGEEGRALQGPELPAAGVRVLELLGRRWAHGSSPGDRPWHGDMDPSHTQGPATTNISPGDFLQDGEKGPKVPLS